MEYLDWHGQPIRVPESPKRDSYGNPCIAEHGMGPADRTCAECSHLFGIAYARRYYKCDQRKHNTRGSATDHRPRWPACGAFVERCGDLRIIDGRA